MSKRLNLTACIRFVVRGRELWLAIAAGLAFSGWYWRWYWNFLQWTFGPIPLTLLFPALTAAYAAFCVWLTVRVVNRKERWAKWTLAAVGGLPVLYVLSIGPLAWMASQGKLPGFVDDEFVETVYLPIIWIIFEGPEPISNAVIWYEQLWR